MALAKLTNSGDVRVLGPWARPQVYLHWLSLLGDADQRAIKEAMHADVDGRDVVRAQYVVCRPGGGDHWFEVYEPAYEAMNHDYSMAAKFIGLILWEVMQEREEQWYFHKIDKTIVDEHNLIEDIQVVEYFRTETLPGALQQRSVRP